MKKFILPITVALSLIATTSFAWTGPTGTAPTLNASAPVNVGSTNQSKNSNLGVNGLAIFGNGILSGVGGAGNAYLNFGSTAGSTGYGIWDNSGTLMFRNSGGAWSAMPISQWISSGADIYFNTGNVGIGTTAPGYKLDVNGDIAGSWIRSRGNTGWYNDTWGGGLSMSDVSWIRTVGSAGIWAGSANIGSNGGITMGYGGAGAPAGGGIFSGNVGIGTSSPGYKLDVTGSINIGGGNLLSLNAGKANVYHDGTNFVLANSVGITGFYNQNAGVLAYRFSATASNNPLVDIDSNGNVGIGTTAPTQKLSVAGTIESTSGGVKFPDGTVQTTASGAGNFIQNQFTSAQVSNAWLSGTVRANLIQAGSGASTGNAGLYQGDGAHAGYVGWYRPDGVTRIGYLGWDIGGVNNLGMGLENGANFNIIGGNVGIGTTAPTYKLDVTGTIRATGGLYSNIVYDTDNNAYYLDPNGSSNLSTVYATQFLYSSDRRLKKNIKNMDSGEVLNGVLSLQGVTYNWIDAKLASSTQIGFIAQDVEELFPELVNTNASTTLKAVDYARFTPLLVEAIKSQEKKIDAQQKQIDKLTLQINTFKK